MTFLKRNKYECLAVLVSLAGFLAACFVAGHIFEGVPHTEDEIAFVWQAKALSHGQLTVPAPTLLRSAWVPFVVTCNGLRFAKYPPGWPMVLALGILLGVRTFVNPFMGGLAVWLTFRLGQKIFNPPAALLAALLTLTSPFFLINSGSLDSHPWSLVLTLAFTLAWLDMCGLGKGNEPAPPDPKPVPRWMPVTTAGLSLGLLIITRPLTALGVALPFFVHGLVLLWRGRREVRGDVLWIGAITILVGALFPVWQYAVTGNPFKNPYTLWWPYDKVGFGPGFGMVKGGHTLWLSIENSAAMIFATAKDLFGWGLFSWLFLPFSLWAICRKRLAWLLAGVFAGLVGMYMLYWAVSAQYGPRYYYEGLASLTLLSAAGIQWLADKMRLLHLRKTLVGLFGALLTLLVGYNLVVYLPARLNGLFKLYGISSSQLAPFLTPQAQALTPALVFVHTEDDWTEYGGLIELEDPWLTTPFIFAWSNSPTANAAMAKGYPDRRVIEYYPREPETLYKSPQ